MAATGSAGLSIWGKVYSNDKLLTMDQVRLIGSEIVIS